MTKWRLGRIREQKELTGLAKPATGTALTRGDIVKLAVLQFLMPALANDFRADIARVAALAEVSEEVAICVWSSWVILSYETLHRIFEDKELAIQHTPFTISKLKEAANIVRLVKKLKSRKERSK